MMVISGIFPPVTSIILLFLLIFCLCVSVWYVSPICVINEQLRISSDIPIPMKWKRLREHIVCMLLLIMISFEKWQTGQSVWLMIFPDYFGVSLSSVFFFFNHFSLHFNHGGCRPFTNYHCCPFKECLCECMSGRTQSNFKILLNIPFFSSSSFFCCSNQKLLLIFMFRSLVSFPFYF